MELPKTERNTWIICSVPSGRKGGWQSGNLKPCWKSTAEQIEAPLWAEGINLTQDQVRHDVVTKQQPQGCQPRPKSVTV